MWVPSFLPSSSTGKQSKLLLQPPEVELGLQIGVEFDKKIFRNSLEVVSETTVLGGWMAGWVDGRLDGWLDQLEIRLS